MSGPWIASFAALTGAVCALAVVLLGFLRRATSVLEAAEARLGAHPAQAIFGGAQPGTRVADFVVRDELGRPVHGSELFGSGAIFLLMESSCEPCRDLADSLARSPDALGGTPLYVVVDESPAGRDFAVPSGTNLYQSGRAASQAFSSIASPQAFAVDGDGVVLDLVIPGGVNDLRRLAAKLAKGGGAGVPDHATAA